jgi:hypothetical protein
MRVKLKIKPPGAVQTTMTPWSRSSARSSSIPLNRVNSGKWRRRPEPRASKNRPRDRSWAVRGARGPLCGCKKSKLRRTRGNIVVWILRVGFFFVPLLCSSCRMGSFVNIYQGNTSSMMGACLSHRIGARCQSRRRRGTLSYSVETRSR